MRRSSICFALPLLASTGLAACKRRPPPAPVAPIAAAPSAPAEEEPDLARPTQYPPRKVWPPPDMSTPVVVVTLNGHPKGPKAGDFDAPQGEVPTKVQTCFDALPPGTPFSGGTVRLAIKYDVVNDGHPKDVTITGEAPADALTCTKTAIEAIAFPKFEGPPVHSSFNVSYSRPQRPDLSTR